MAIAARLQAQAEAAIGTQTPVPVAVGSNYEIFTPTAPQPAQPVPGQAGLTGSPNRPGQAQYLGPEVFANGMGGLTNVEGGEPLISTSDRIHRPPGAYTLVRAPSYRLRKGVGQKGPSSLGIAQTIEQATRNTNPPGGQSLLSMIAGLG